jgi:small subunit ribosomal protein S20
MPITKSAKKALRQSKRRRIGNLSRINAYRNTVKQFKKLVTASQLKEASAKLAVLYKSVDKAAKSGVIKSNKAARLKSWAQKALNPKK